MLAWEEENLASRGVSGTKDASLEFSLPGRCFSALLETFAQRLTLLPVTVPISGSGPRRVLTIGCGPEQAQMPESRVCPLRLAGPPLAEEVLRPFLRKTSECCAPVLGPTEVMEPAGWRKTQLICSNCSSCSI